MPNYQRMKTLLPSPTEVDLPSDPNIFANTGLALATRTRAYPPSLGILPHKSATALITPSSIPSIVQEPPTVHAAIRLTGLDCPRC